MAEEAAPEEPAAEVSAEVSTAPGDMAIDMTTFPDYIFRKYVEENCDTNGDKVLSAAEIAAVTKISVVKMGIRSLKGAEETLPEMPVEEMSASQTVE